MTTVEFSAEAISDLEQIGQYISQESPYWASRFIQELIYACGTIADLPLGYPLYPDRETSGIRKKVYKRYLIFYRFEATEVSIIHILHGARDYERILFPDDEQP
jgi:toxin ParE1/3/4